MGLRSDFDDESVVRAFDELQSLRANLNGPDDFARLIDKFRESIADGTWEFMGTDGFVSAQAIAIRNFRGACEAQNIPCSEPPNWPAVSLAFIRAMTIA